MPLTLISDLSLRERGVESSDYHHFIAFDCKGKKVVTRLAFITVNAN